MSVDEVGRVHLSDGETETILDDYDSLACLNGYDDLLDMIFQPGEFFGDNDDAADSTGLPSDFVGAE